MAKTVQSCGTPYLHETGTTFFTDGTSGWTQGCADQMMAQYTPAPPVETLPLGENVAPPGRFYTQEDLDNGFEPAPYIPAN